MEEEGGGVRERAGGVREGGGSSCHVTLFSLSTGP
jgi:hypothetical protein